GTVLKKPSVGIKNSEANLSASVSKMRLSTSLRTYLLCVCITVWPNSCAQSNLTRSADFVSFKKINGEPDSSLKKERASISFFCIKKPRTKRGLFLSEYLRIKHVR